MWSERNVNETRLSSLSLASPRIPASARPSHPHPYPPSTVRHSRRSFRPEDVGRGWKTRPEDVETEGTTHGGRNMTTKGLTLMPWVSRSLRFSVLSAREHAIHPRSLPSSGPAPPSERSEWHAKEASGDNVRRTESTNGWITRVNRQAQEI